MPKCANRCDVLIKCIKGLFRLLCYTDHNVSYPRHDNHESIDQHENTLLQYFEDNFAAAAPNHRDDCIRRSLNVLHNNIYKGDDNPITLLRGATCYGMFNLVSKLLEYGANPTLTSKNTSSLGYVILYNTLWYNNVYSKKIRRFIKRGPKTYIENEFLKKIIGYINGDELRELFDVAKNGYNPFFSETLIRYDAKLDYWQIGRGSSKLRPFSLLMMMIIFSYEDETIEHTMCEYFDFLTKHYDFMVEGYHEDYIGYRLSITNNILKYAQKHMNNKKIICGKIIDYFANRSDIGKEINTLLPMPIAEEIIPHILPPNNIDQDNKFKF